MRAARFVAGFFLALAVFAAGAWWLQWQQSLALAGEAALLRDEQRELARLRAEHARLAAAQVSPAEIERLRADHAAVARLRAEIGALQDNVVKRERALAPPTARDATAGPGGGPRP